MNKIMNILNLKINISNCSNYEGHKFEEIERSHGRSSEKNICRCNFYWHCKNCSMNIKIDCNGLAFYVQSNENEKFPSCSEYIMKHVL